MDTLTFISKILEYLSWPITVVIFIVIFRRSLSKVIESIRLKKLKRGDLEIDFSEEVSELKERSEALQSPEKLLPPKSIGKVSMRSTEPTKIEDVDTLIKINPAAGINLSWAYVDREIRATIIRLGLSTEDPMRGSSISHLRLLKQNKYLNDDSYNILMELRNLRDKSAHLLYDPSLTVQAALEYNETAQLMIKQLSEIQHIK